LFNGVAIIYSKTDKERNYGMGEAFVVVVVQQKQKHLIDSIVCAVSALRVP